MSKWIENARKLEDVQQYELRSFSDAEVISIREAFAAPVTSQMLHTLEKQYDCFSESFVYALYDHAATFLSQHLFQLIIDLNADAAELTASLTFVHTLARLRANAWLIAVGTAETPPIRALQVFNGMPITRGFLFGPNEFMQKAFKCWASDIHCIASIEPFSYLVNPDQEEAAILVWKDLLKLITSDTVSVESLPALLDFFESLQIPTQQLSPAAYTAYSVSSSSTSIF